jgi:hypothetical protein
MQVKDFYFDAAFDNFRTFSAVPEPSTLMLLGAGLIAFAGIARKKTGSLTRYRIEGIGAPPGSHTPGPDLEGMAPQTPSREEVFLTRIMITSS